MAVRFLIEHNPNSVFNTSAPLIEECNLYLTQFNVIVQTACMYDDCAAQLK